MKTDIRLRIFLPLMVLLLLIPLCTGMAFPVISSAYMMDLARDAISATLADVGAIVDEVYDDADVYLASEAAIAEGEKQERAREFLYQTRHALRRGQFDSSIIVLSKSFSQLYPNEQSPETSGITEFFSARMALENMDDAREHFQEIAVGEQQYLACLVRLTDPQQVLSNYMIAYSSINDATSLITQSTWLVLVITALLALGALALTWRMATGISRPIRKLGEHVARIGAGDFTEVDQHSSVREIEELISATNAMAARLRRYDQAQKMFFQNASHELRTPLMSIQGYAEGIQAGVLEDVSDAASVIAEESVRLTELVGGLITLSRIDNDQESVEIVPIPLNELLKGELRRLEGVALQRKITLRLREPLPNALVDADEQLTTKALGNVLSNALRYAASQVLLTAWQTEAQVVVRIADDGPGIPPEQAEHVFDRFHKGKGGNSGIGLSVARASMEYMQGSIQLAQSDSGAAFELCFKRHVDQ